MRMKSTRLTLTSKEPDFTQKLTTKKVFNTSISNQTPFQIKLSSTVREHFTFVGIFRFKVIKYMYTVKTF